MVAPAAPALAALRVLCAAGALVLAAGLAGCGTAATGFGLDVVPDAQVAQMGVETWRQIRAETPVSSNASYRAAAERVASRVLRAAGEDPREWEVVVFSGAEANAFALPGRKIGVYEGMFRVADSEAELAAVIAHEVAHLEADHPGERVSNEATTQLGVELASSVLGGGNSGLLAALLGAGARYGLTLPYSRNQELEADRLGLQYMARAGYDPRAALALWQDMGAAGGARSPSFLSTHPAPGERMEALRRQLPQALALYRG